MTKRGNGMSSAEMHQTFLIAGNYLIIVSPIRQALYIKQFGNHNISILFVHGHAYYFYVSLDELTGKSSGEYYAVIICNFDP